MQHVVPIKVIYEAFWQFLEVTLPSDWSWRSTSRTVLGALNFSLAHGPQKGKSYLCVNLILHLIEKTRGSAGIFNSVFRDECRGGTNKGLKTGWGHPPIVLLETVHTTVCIGLRIFFFRLPNFDMDFHDRDQRSFILRPTTCRPNIFG